MSSSILDVITHYQKSIERSTHDEARLLHCIEKLYKLPITVEHLQSTGVGKTVNSLRKFNGEVGIAAKTLVSKWKAMVAAEENDTESNDEAKKTSYNDDDKASGTSSTSGFNKLSSSSANNISKIPNDQTQYTSNNSINSSNSEGHDRTTKRKLESDKLCNDDYRDSGNNRKHHKKSKREFDSNKNENNFDNRKSEIENVLLNIKEEKLNSFEYDNESSTEYDDEGEKLVIDVKVKTEESEDEISSENVKIMNDKKFKSDKKEKNSSHSKAESSSSSRKDRKEETDRRSSSKDKKTSHSHHSKSRHLDEKKTKHKEDESRSSLHHNHHHHKSRNEKEKSHKDKHRDKDKGKDNSSSKHRSPSKHDRNHDNKKSSDNSTLKDKKNKTSQDVDSKSDHISTKTKAEKISDEGIDSSMGTSFEEALGILNASSSSSSSSTSKNSSKVKLKTINPGNSISFNEDNFKKPLSRDSSSKTNKTSTPELLTSTTKLTPLDPSIALELPPISPNYKPMPLNPIVMDCVFNNKQHSQRKVFTDEEALAAGISSKTIRTKVYSGVKTGQLMQVPSLFDLCIWVLQKNIDALEYTGGVPFDVLKPVLELASPLQLANFEEYNPYLIEDTDILWERICARHCKGVKRQEFETWREMYMRCQEEREERLSKLKEDIKQSQKQITQPLRKTQLAYVDSMVKPPRNIQRKQEQFGTSHKKVTTPAARVASLSNLTPNIAKAPIRINPGERDTAQATAHSRPKKAPLMQKTLQFMKDDDEFVPSKPLKISKSEYSLRNGIKEGNEIIPNDTKQIRLNGKRRLWQRRCLGLGILDNNSV